MKKNLFIMARALALCLFMAFTFRPGINDSTKPREDFNKPVKPDLYLYSLYLENANPNNSQVQKLVQLINATLDGKRRKIIFQFFYGTDGVLTLGIYGGSRKNDRYRFLNFRLAYYDDCTKINIENMGIYLSDQEFNRQDLKSDSIPIYAAKPDSKFMVFTPFLDSLSFPGRIIINYQVTFVSDLNEICNPPLVFTGSTTAITTNPSPPRNGN